MLILFLLLSFLQPTKSAISIKVSGLKPSKGSVFVALHDSKNFLTTTFCLTKITPVGASSTALITLPDVPSGTYAVALYQDLNKNQQLDKNFVGAPTEPFGFSNNVKVTFSAPSFAEAKFTHGASVTNLDISLQKW